MGSALSHPAPALLPDDTAPQAPPKGAAEPDPMLGRVIAGRFTVLARLGAGAMGAVYRAKQARIGREVAIKILRSDRALDEGSRARFLREARANSLLTSPNTVTVFDFGADDDGDFYLAMELLEGESVGQRIRRIGRFDTAAAVDVARQALRSLAEAHSKGIIHRDLKPDNLFFARTRTNDTYEEIVKVLDFGVAKMLHADSELAMSAIETQAGTVFGTPRYMSPEQAQGKVLDTRSDLYSLGVILYQMLTGRPPFTDDDAVVVMARHIKTAPRPMTEVAPDARISAEIEATVMRALSKEPDGRPETAEAMAAELARAFESSTPSNNAPTSSISSGVRVSLRGDEGPVADPLPAPAPPWPARNTPSDAPLATDDVAALRPRRGLLAGIALVATGAALAYGLGLSGRDSGTAPRASSAISLPAVPVVTHADEVAPPAATSSASSVPGPSTPHMAATAAASPPSASARPAASAVRHTAGPARNPPTKPASAPSVGYGYLE